MNKPITVRLATGEILRIIIAVILLVLAGRAFTADAQTVTILHSFGSNSKDGAGSGGLVQGSDGNFYGTTGLGGTTNTDVFGRRGYGILYRISPSGSETNLYSFTGPPNDGSYPSGWLIQGSDGNFYGTTSNLYGTVFRISLGGDYTNLYIFTGSPNDGRYPVAGLVQGSDGNFYGTTGGGGSSSNGTVFRISPSGNYTNLYSFFGPPNDGSQPNARLVQGSDGNFYGEAASGGMSSNCIGGCGTVFRINPSGTYTTLYSFVGSPNDGRSPIGGLVQGLDGNFYGATPIGGMNNNGTVFRISPSGSETNLYSIAGLPNVGGQPSAGLVQGSDGNFYGTTVYGGNTNLNFGNGYGTVFRISPSGTCTTLYSFGSNSNDGLYPGVLVQGSDGNFYGTTSRGGINTSGTVFRLSVPLNPPANQVSGVQFSGTNIVFNIPSVAYETYQLQFSSSMNPTNWVNVPGVSVTNCIGALLTLTNFGGALQPQGFYRFDITP